MFCRLFRRSRPAVPGPIAPAASEAPTCICGSVQPAFEGGFDEDSTSTVAAHTAEPEPAPLASFEPAFLDENTECKSLTAAGEPCLAPARKASGFCIFHDPGYREVHRANSVVGGRASARSREGKEAQALTASFVDPEARLFLLGYLLEGQLRGQLSQAQTNALLRTFQMLFKAEQTTR